MSHKRAIYLTPGENASLNAACLEIARVFGNNPPYLVGSVLHRADHHDVDVRLMLPDAVFARMFRDGYWLGFANMLVSQYLANATKLRIDFQFQDTTEANRGFGRDALGCGNRSALGMWLDRPEDKP